MMPILQIIESVPDSLPELRALIEQREDEHTQQIEAKDSIIVAQSNASDVLGGQLTAADDLLAGVQSDLDEANDQISLLEDLKHPGLSNLEAVSLGAGAYLVTTEVLGGTTLEGVVSGAVTFLVTKGGSKLIRWMF